MNSNTPTGLRQVARIITGMPATDGAGVELVRIIGQSDLPMLDPFLLLDAFGSDEPDKYIAGFPPHPHRGFETVTYLLAGRMRHSDSAGHEGVIEPGGVQWMTAGRGIVHAEMPEQEDGLLQGFQLWINLPAANKLDQPAYQEYSAHELPVEHRNNGTRITVISGTTSQGTSGPVAQPLTDPHYFDITLAAGTRFEEVLPADYNAFIYVISGTVEMVGQSTDSVILRDTMLGILTHGDHVEMIAGKQGARLLLLAGQPLDEPVARAGPFVMNTRAEIHQAMQDYAEGRLEQGNIEP